MSISIHSYQFTTVPAQDYRALLKLRYKVFSERLHWELETHQGLESDEYDIREPTTSMPKAMKGT